MHYNSLCFDGVAMRQNGLMRDGGVAGGVVTHLSARAILCDALMNMTPIVVPRCELYIVYFCCCCMRSVRCYKSLGESHSLALVK